MRGVAGLNDELFVSNDCALLSQELMYVRFFPEFWLYGLRTWRYTF